jgi:hypothetical protein
MLTPFLLRSPQPQSQMSYPPYDFWVNPAGDIAAEFYRTPGGYLVRFPDQADFEIVRQGLEVRCTPAPEASPSLAQTLFQNSIRPIIGNHRGELNLHGSAVAVDDAAIAFLGLSRRGKTTLAGAFAHSGHPFLTEDVIQLEPSGTGYILNPQDSHLRLFPDSASFLLGDELAEDCSEEKTAIQASGHLPHCGQSLPLRVLFILGPGESDSPRIQPISQSAAIGQLLQQSFILDVEDRVRLRGHFQRLGDLARSVPCFELDYPRSFDQLGHVIEAVTRLVRSGQS